MDPDSGAAAASHTNPVILGIKVEIADLIREIATHLENGDDLGENARALLERSRDTLLQMVQEYDTYERENE